MIAVGARLGPFGVVGRLGAGGQGEVLLASPWDERPLRRAADVQLLSVLHRTGRLSPAHAQRWRLAALKLGHTAASIHDEHAYLAAMSTLHPHLGCLYSRRFPGVGRDLSLLSGIGIDPKHSQSERTLPGFTARSAQPGAQTPLAVPSRCMLALAFVPGAPLDRRLRRRSALPIGWTLVVVRQVATALGQLHAQGLVHHDVRPANVIVRTEHGAPHAVLIDLGASELRHAPRPHAVYGVAASLPPERRDASPAPPTAGVDIFGLGVLLRALIAGCTAPPALAALIEDATEPNPVRRNAALPTIRTFQERLEELAQSRYNVMSPSRRSLDARPVHPIA